MQLICALKSPITNWFIKINVASTRFFLNISFRRVTPSLSRAACKDISQNIGVVLGSVVLNVGGPGWTGLDISTPLLPVSVPGTDTDPASLFSGRMGSAKFTFDSLPYINFHVTVLEFAYSVRLASLKTILQYQNAFCLMPSWGPGPGWWLRLQTPSRGSCCCPTHILRRGDTRERDCCMRRCR